MCWRNDQNTSQTNCYIWLIYYINLMIRVCFVYWLHVYVLPTCTMYIKMLLDDISDITTKIMNGVIIGYVSKHLQWYMVCCGVHVRTYSKWRSTTLCLSIICGNNLIGSIYACNDKYQRGWHSVSMLNRVGYNKFLQCINMWYKHVTCI